MKQLLCSEPYVDNNVESWIIEYTEKIERKKK